MNGNELHALLKSAQYDFEGRFDERWALEWMQENCYKSFVFCGLYAAFVFAGQHLMRERPKLNLRRPLVLWSLSLAVFSIVGALRTGFYMLHMIRTAGFRDSVCDNVFYSAPITKLWAYAFTLSKAPELGDTVFIVLRKQRLIFLHWYHHITVLLYSWFSYRDQVAGGGWFMTMNYTVHAFMYSYYAAKAAGLRVPRPCAMVITAAQILQMAMGLTVLGLVHRWMDQDRCQTTMENIAWGSLMYLSYLILFALFFYDAYLKGSPKGKGSKSE
ncbi:elongation of very long chain fatty acids protein 6-like [Takifugu flavidus]|uniref:Elongation of very long chain fatty acids protein 6 n=1 Tax=Takifugu flavidus TaxID=433684 RepID=A0A5C6PSY8_9TELE|nr:elongation of very long chain fatty acids protein 6-like [Takifugu flavidus]TWW82096.1 Elongation of very long chain fatty acids protein 6 [Takifugu flavidus]